MRCGMCIALAQFVCVASYVAGLGEMGRPTAHPLIVPSLCVTLLLHLGAAYPRRTSSSFRTAALYEQPPLERGCAR